jgi:membrane dipeptidase
MIERTIAVRSFTLSDKLMSLIIDAHEDLAYNALNFQRDYLLSAAETRRLEKDTLTPQRNGQTLLGWPDYQRGQVAAVFGTLFLTPRRFAGEWDAMAFTDTSQSQVLYEKQITYYLHLCDDHPDYFRLITNQKDLREVLTPWEQAPAYLPAERSGEEQPPQPTVTHPVGIVLLMEGTEGIRSAEEMEYWWEKGVRLAGPVWAGTQFCGGTLIPGEFTREGLALLDIMAGLGYILDLSHMNEVSSLQALDRYDGPIVATHANARALLKNAESERQFTDHTIRRLIERGGVMGVVPYNRFLNHGWQNSDDRRTVTLCHLIAHIDHICQLAGNANHVGLGTDFDGGFGWPAVPYEIDTIADLQKLSSLLAKYGYNEENIAAILGENWRRQLERNLPQS